MTGVQTCALPISWFYVGLGSALTGAGSLDAWGVLGTNLGPFACNDVAGDNLTIPAHGCSVDDRVMFFPEGSELALLDQRLLDPGELHLLRRHQYSYSYLLKIN